MVKVRSHMRWVGGKNYPVKSYTRKSRPVSPKIKRYTSVGTFEVAHDKYGNLKGSRIKKFKKKRSPELITKDSFKEIEELPINPKIKKVLIKETKAYIENIRKDLKQA